MNSDIQWFVDCWGLPETAIPAVEALLLAEENGSTAVEIDAATAEVLRAVYPEENAPLRVVEIAGQPYLQATATFRKEAAIRERFLAAAKAEPQLLPEDFNEWSEKLFSDSVDEHQVAALRLAWERPLCCITGGPGSGKTYTLARILALFVLSKKSISSLLLCAPTGKAAQRMRDAIKESLDRLQDHLPSEAIERLKNAADNATTLHRLIGYNPVKMECRLKEFPQHSVVVVDESSMLDLNMWHALFQRLPEINGRLILLGDPQQLESIGPGEVLTSFFNAVNEGLKPHGPRLKKLHVHLSGSHRSKDRRALQELDLAMRIGDPEKAVVLLREQTDPAAPQGLYWHEVESAGFEVDELPLRIKERLRDIAFAPDPETAMDAIQRVCLLSAHNNDWMGVGALNRQIISWLTQLETCRNRPIIIKTNDAETGLRNGTVGLLHTDHSGEITSWFPETGGGLQPFPLSRLPDYQPAWAITIHRAQGSEYDDVCVMLPPAESRLTKRALLYTAVTRARKAVYLYGSADGIEKAIRTPSSRKSLIFG